MKTTSFVALFEVFLSAIFFSSCDVVDSSQVSSSTDYATYSASYDQNTHSASYSAHFSVGGDEGTVLDLDGQSRVTIDGNSMEGQRDIFNDLYYVANESSASLEVYQETHEFQFVDQSGVMHQNDFTFPSLISPTPSQSMNASLLYGFAVIWEAQGPASPEDVVTATLTRADGVNASTSGAAGSGGVLAFSASDLAPLGAGEVTLTLCHSSQTTNIQGDSEGGLLQTTSCSQNYGVTLN
jgi:hypothetical protein